MEKMIFYRHGETPDFGISLCGETLVFGLKHWTLFADDYRMCRTLKPLNVYAFVPEDNEVWFFKMPGESHVPVGKSCYMTLEGATPGNETKFHIRSSVELDQISGAFDTQIDGRNIYVEKAQFKVTPLELRLDKRIYNLKDVDLKLIR